MSSFQDIWLEKVAAQASDVTNNPKPTLVVTFNENDQAVKSFIERLDKVLGSMSGIERLQIKAFNNMKDQNAIKQLKALPVGIALFSRGKMVDSLGVKAMENDIRKFMESNRKYLVA